jgi:protein SCO1/2
MNRCIHSALAALVLALGASGSLTGCRQANPAGTRASGAAAVVAATRTFQVKGVVQSLAPDRQTIHIRHEEIPGYMPAMTMPFTVRDPGQLGPVAPGDTVAFRLVVTSDDGWIEDVNRLESGPGPTTRPVVESVRVARIVDELKEGDEMPDYRFTTELGRSVRLSQFRGQALGFTFFYTRCPYPTFCPRMTANFAAASASLRATRHGPRNWRLLSISFDPAYDIPATLRTYAKSHQYDPDRWSFVTGAIIDIDAITEQFGMFFARDGANFSHNVRTVVVNAQGRIQRIFVGNQWSVDDFVAEMVKAAQARPVPAPAARTRRPGP